VIFRSSASMGGNVSYDSITSQSSSQTQLSVIIYVLCQLS
jgi:hypothetical protein